MKPHLIQLISRLVIGLFVLGILGLLLFSKLSGPKNQSAKVAETNNMSPVTITNPSIEPSSSPNLPEIGNVKPSSVSSKSQVITSNKQGNDTPVKTTSRVTTTQTTMSRKTEVTRVQTHVKTSMQATVTSFTTNISNVSASASSTATSESATATASARTY